MLLVSTLIFTFALLCCSPISDFATSRFTDNETNTLLDTASFLRFNIDRADTVFVPGHADVRGIPCEEWTQFADVTNDTSAHYNMSFYFPVSQVSFSDARTDAKCCAG